MFSVDSDVLRGTVEPGNGDGYNVNRHLLIYDELVSLKEEIRRLSVFLHILETGNSILAEDESKPPKPSFVDFMDMAPEMIGSMRLELNSLINKLNSMFDGGK